LALLLGLAVFINYIDRGNLATAAPVLRGELNLSVEQIGVLLSAFFWTYTPMQLVSGWLAERFNAGRVIAIGFAIWSVATLITGLVSGFAILLGLRLLLGLGESVYFPCSGKLLASHTATGQRGRANAGVAAGLAFGPAFGTFVGGGLILARYGWRPLFISTGALSLLWLWPWLAGGGPARVITKTVTGGSGPGPTFEAIISRRELWGASLFHFGSNYGLYLLVSWLPTYLVQDRGFTITRMARLGGAVYFVMGATAIAAGWVVDRWIRSGATPNRAYKTIMIAGQSAMVVCLMGVVAGSTLVSSVCLLLAGSAWGVGSPGTFAAAQIMAGPAAAGRWMGFQNFVGNLAGISGPIITGVLVAQTGNFYAAFVFAIVVTLVGLLAWTVVVPRIEPLGWGSAMKMPNDEVRPAG
jgi:MFS family permease